MLDKIQPTIAWYKWILKFHPVKYAGIAIMTLGPLIAVFRLIFLGSPSLETVLIASGSLVIGALIWRMGWDPYS
jgi:hypothetical protein